MPASLGQAQTRFTVTDGCAAVAGQSARAGGGYGVPSSAESMLARKASSLLGTLPETVFGTFPQASSIATNLVATVFDLMSSGSNVPSSHR